MPVSNCVLADFRVLPKSEVPSRRLSTEAEADRTSLFSLQFSSSSRARRFWPSSDGPQGMLSRAVVGVRAFTRPPFPARHRCQPPARAWSHYSMARVLHWMHLRRDCPEDFGPPEHDEEAVRDAILEKALKGRQPTDLMLRCERPQAAVRFWTLNSSHRHRTGRGGYAARTYAKPAAQVRYRKRQDHQRAVQEVRIVF